MFQYVCVGLLAFATFIFLTAFQRFSATDYPVIPESQLLQSLLPSAAFDDGGGRHESPPLNNNLAKSSSNKNQFKNRSKPYCQIDLTVLKDYTVRLDASLPNAAALKSVGTGGAWQPQQCHPKYQVVVIVPYRDRPDHLRRFLQLMHPFLQSQQLDYKIVVVEQAPGKEFNRAKLFNVGFLESKAVFGHTSCLIFHDVDLIPLDARNIYACTEEPRHLSSNLDQFRFNLPYVDLFGGAVAMTTELFEEANGFSNLYFGWGGEDDDFRQNRIPSRKIIRLEPHISRYTSLKHKQAKPSANRFKILEGGKKPEVDEKVEAKGDFAPGPPELDGLSNIEYKLLETQQKQLYTLFVVDI